MRGINDKPKGRLSKTYQHMPRLFTGAAPVDCY